MSELQNLTPKNVWKYFDELCQIPRPSHYMDLIVPYIKKFGEDLGLETHADSVGNVLIRKPGTKGFEDRKTVVLQAHLDMVPQKTKASQHDFKKDPIKAYIDEEWVTADGTTLGADNGIGAAYMMAILAADDIEHGPIEALFTTDEEDGMIGAFGLSKDLLKGDFLINIDSEEEGIFYIGCAGGEVTTGETRLELEDVPSEYVTFAVELSGLKGGHSGCDIHLYRGNANKILNRLCWLGTRDYGLRLVSFSGGNASNAIPRDAIAHIALPKEKATAFEAFVKEFEGLVKIEQAATDPDLTFDIRSIELPEKVVALKQQKAILGAIYGCPHGVFRMSDDVKGLVETSNNLANVQIKDGHCSMLTMQRSSITSAKDDIAAMIEAVFDLAGLNVEHSGTYPGWKPNAQSPILKVMQNVYQKLFKKEAEVTAIHAGLECGLIGSLYPDMDMISIGPTLEAVHSPDEKLEIKTVEEVWKLLLAVLKEIPK